MRLKASRFLLPVLAVGLLALSGCVAYPAYPYAYPSAYGYGPPAPVYGGVVVGGYGGGGYRGGYGYRGGWHR